MSSKTLLTLLKLAVVGPAIALTALAYSSLFPAENRYLIMASIAAILLGLFLSSGSAGRVVSLSAILYTVPYTIWASQFLPIAFPKAYRELSETIFASQYLPNLQAIFLLIGLSLLADYIETAEEWEEVLEKLGRRGMGIQTMTYSVPIVLGALALSLGLLNLGEVSGIKMSAILLPVILLAIGLAIAYGSVEGGKYRKVVLAVEISSSHGGGEVIVQTSEGEKSFPILPSVAFEWDVIRIEAELKERPKEVFLKMGEKRKPLKPLIESVDRETLFLLYREES
ncbi:hypothetical protein [Thermococcus sp. GR6]|uniref:hypothetical protein n=1 Tax=Thermococcus sp. GR6 TaxID=1638256 RepID=UPI0014316CAA|nr:hypothetical protein [Thermococcus sp. GR6]NJE43279.1 hypothetical protein [Thermococcus sp. GR6]